VAKILLVEDDRDLSMMVKAGLEGERHVVETAFDGDEAVHLIKTEDYDVVVLDWQLPELSGIDVLKKIRQMSKPVSVIMLTGRSGIDHKEEGMDTGADDYLTKPFDMRELHARLRALLRRPGGAAGITGNTLMIGDLELDPVKYRLTRGSKDIHLTPKDFALLEFFMRNPDHVFSVQTILSRVWSYESDASPEGLRAAIRRIRKAVDVSDDPNESIIENVARVGYRLRKQG
jgi:DNA-binding response OmpR family regulator